jgi:aryl-alcohol dehydrogenase-like predicted oxidoreductase
MERRRIGSLEVSSVALGCNNFGRRLDYLRTASVVDAALDSGILLFDTADVYGGTQSEEFLGRALGARRARVAVATKFGIPLNNSGRAIGKDDVRRALEDSLRRLRTDYIDLYQLHRPLRHQPVGETLGVLDELVRAGKVREIGCSFFSAAELREAGRMAAAGARFVSVQNEYSLLHREPEEDVLPECGHAGLAFLAFSPLAGGLLTGKYRSGSAAPAGSRLAGDADGRFFNARNLALLEPLSAFAAARGRTLLELAVSWLAGREHVASVIVGAMSAEQVRANVAAAGWRLDPGDREGIDHIVPRRKLLFLRRAVRRAQAILKRWSTS